MPTKRYTEQSTARLFQGETNYDWNTNMPEPHAAHSGLPVTSTLAKNMKPLLKTTLILITTISISFATTPEENQFKDTLVTALKSQNKTDLYSLVCLDDLDAKWTEMAKGSLESMLAQIKVNGDFTATIEPADTSVLKPRPFKDGVLVQNLEVTAVCRLRWPDSATQKNQVSTFNIGKKNGKLLISCLTFQKKE